MKPDMVTLCLLGLTILASTSHVLSFLTAAGPATAVNGAAAAIAQQQQQQQPQHSRSTPNMFVMPADGAAIDSDETAAFQQRQLSLEAQQQQQQQRNVYDPGDELLRALNIELGQELEPERDLMREREPEPDYATAVEVANKFDMLKKLEQDLRAEQELVDKSALLMKMLEDPSLETLPLVYVEEEEEPTVMSAEDYPELDNGLQSLIIGQTKSKRSRYYRRYPWKRHNRNRGNYEPELRYACTPSKEDIFKLLVNLHENRKGNHSKTVNFCNRKRPAKVIFTNIRFLG